LVLLASDENDDSFEHVLKEQIKQLRKQLDKTPSGLWVGGFGRNVKPALISCPPVPPKPDMLEVARIERAQAIAGFSPSQSGPHLIY
jgi:hypothetical protein